MSRLLFIICFILIDFSSSRETDDVVRNQIAELTSLAPVPILEKGTAVVNVHFQNIGQSHCSNVQMKLTPLIAIETETHTAEIDAATATASFTLQLEGTAKCTLSNAAIPTTTCIYLAPGETIDIWCDMNEVVKRNKQLEDKSSPILNVIPVTTNGHYAEVNNHDRVFRSAHTDIVTLYQRHDSGTFSSSAEAAASLVNDYLLMCSHIINTPGSKTQKALSIIELRLEAAHAAACAGKVTDISDLERIFKVLDLNDTRLLLGHKAITTASVVYAYKDILPDCPLISYYETALNRAIAKTAVQKL